ncbi:MAG: ATP-binding protein [Caldilineaceae bacterium]
MTTIKSLLRQGPGPRLAFLPDPDPEEIAATLVAFANSEGGTIVLGAHANGAAGEILLDEEAEGALREALSICRPPVATQWSQEQTPAGAVVLITVERSSDLHTLADGRTLVRSGSENRPLSGTELQILTANKTIGDFETEPVSGARREDLDEQVIDEYLEKRRERSPRGTSLAKNTLLEQIGAINAEGEPTVSGMLLFGKEPQLFLPQSRVVFVKFADTQPRGPEGAFGYGRREEIVGPLAKVIERAWRVTWEEMDKQAIVKGLQREEQLEYPQFAVREALVNAVCHRDYKLRGSNIEIRMYTDRLEIISPGGLPAYITIDNIIEEHYSRNPRWSTASTSGATSKNWAWHRPHDRRHGRRRSPAA